MAVEIGAAAGAASSPPVARNRTCVLDRTGRWLLAENQDSHSVVIFSIDPASGRLQPNGEKVEVGSPLCLFRHCGKPELKPPSFACAQFRTRKNLRGSLAGLA